MAAAPSTDKRWLFGPIPDLLLGCGLAYVAVFALLAAEGERLQTLIPFALFPLLNIFIGAPHYGATLLRVYERRRDRRAYALFAVHASIAIAVAFVWGLYDANVGSWLLTLYLTWSPWHYSGQNYGIALMFLHRRGVTVTPAIKRLIYASFGLSFALTFLALHGTAPAATYAPQGLSGMVYQLRSLGIPEPIVSAGMNGLAAVYAGVLLALGAALLRRGSLSDVAPTAALVGTQALWFSIPALTRQWGLLADVLPLSAQQSDYTFVWIAFGHAAQYLWITAYYAARERRATSHLRFFVRSVLAGMAIWTVPAALFAPGLLGGLPYDAGLGALVAAMVNIHHFVLDGAIWKLRDGRVARILLRASEAPDAIGPEPPRRSLVWPVVAAAGALSIALTATWIYEDVYGFRRAFERGDLRRAERAVDRLALLGRDGPEYHYRLALEQARAGALDAAQAQLETSLALQATPRAWMLRGNLYRREQDWSRAAEAYERAAELDPGAAIAFYQAGEARLQLGHVRRAHMAFEAALRLAPDDERFRAAFERVNDGILRWRRSARRARPQ